MKSGYSSQPIKKLRSVHQIGKDFEIYFQLNFYRFNFPRGQDGKVKDLGSVLQLLDKLLIFRSEVLEINSFESFSDIVQALFDL